MRIATYAIAMALVLGSMSCGREGYNADAQQLARINKDLGALEARVETLGKQLDQLNARMEQMEHRVPDTTQGQVLSGQTPDTDNLGVEPVPALEGQEGAMTVDLGPPKKGVQLMVVTIGDKLLVDGKPVSENDLATKLREHAKRGGNGQLLIRANHDVSPVRIMRVIDLAKQSGIAKFALVNDSTSPPKARTTTPPAKTK